MLIIFEGLDKSGKSSMAGLMQNALHGLSIRKTYNKVLYPIDYSKASVYDWQALLDRVILANPEHTFVADRSFFTQTVYQLCLGTGEHAITTEQMSMFNNYCKTVKQIPHLVVYCKSARYELDSMVTNITIRRKLDELYEQTLTDSGLNVLILNTDEGTLFDKYQKVLQAINMICK